MARMYSSFMNRLYHCSEGALPESACRNESPNAQEKCSPIRYAGGEAKEKVAIEELHLHDFRHTCITTWVAMGIPQPAIMAAAGHHPIQQNQDYTNMKDAHLKQAFRNSTPV